MPLPIRLKILAQTVAPALLALLCALLLYSGFYLTRDTTFLGDVAEEALDTRMALRVDAAKASPDADMVFVDFDNRTMRLLGDPALVDPIVIASVLTRISKVRPRLVLVDADLSAVRRPEEIAALQTSLDSLNSLGVPVLLARPSLSADTSGAPRRLRSTPLDSFVASRSNIAWVAVDVGVSDDGILRRLRPFVIANRGGDIVALPSPQLIAVLLRRTGSLVDAQRAFADGLKVASDCPSTGRPAWCFTTNGKRLYVDKAEGDRIRFVASWPPRRDAGMLRLPAWSLLNDAAPLERPIVASGKIVIVGASAADRMDLHYTPVGRMPGGFVLANAMSAWLDSGSEASSGFVSGLVLVIIATVATLTLISLVLRLTPTGLRGIVDALLPPVLTGALWLVFLALGQPASVALVIIQYCTAASMIAAARLVSAHKGPKIATVEAPDEGH